HTYIHTVSQSVSQSTIHSKQTRLQQLCILGNVTLASCVLIGGYTHTHTYIHTHTHTYTHTHTHTYTHQHTHTNTHTHTHTHTHLLCSQAYFPLLPSPV